MVSSFFPHPMELKAIKPINKKIKILDLGHQIDEDEYEGYVTNDNIVESIK